MAEEEDAMRENRQAGVGLVHLVMKRDLAPLRSLIGRVDISRALNMVPGRPRSLVFVFCDQWHIFE